MANPYNKIGTQSQPVVPTTKAPEQGRDIPAVKYDNVPAARAQNTAIRTPNTSSGGK